MDKTKNFLNHHQFLKTIQNECKEKPKEITSEEKTNEQNDHFEIIRDKAVELSSDGSGNVYSDYEDLREYLEDKDFGDISVAPSGNNIIVCEHGKEENRRAVIDR